MPDRTRVCIWSNSIFLLTNRNKNCANYIKGLHIGAARWHFVILSVSEEDEEEEAKQSVGKHGYQGVNVSQDK